jgi:hypothetical protein
MLRVAAPLRVRLWSGSPAAAGAQVVAEAGALRCDGGQLRAAPPDADASASPQRTKHVHDHLIAAFKARSPLCSARARVLTLPRALQAGFVERATVVASADNAVDVEVVLQLPVRAQHSCASRRGG